MGYVRVWPRPLTHFSDDRTGKTLCGVDYPDNWDDGDWAGDVTELCELQPVTCRRCMNTVERLRKELATPAKGESQNG